MLKFFRVITVVALVLWMIMIFTLSAQTAAESSQTSSEFSYRVFSLFYPDFDNLSESEQAMLIENTMFYVRKAAHFTIYTVLAFLAYFSVVTYKKITPYAAVFAGVFSMLYAASDEFHQLYIGGRSGEFRDVFIDSCGIWLGVLFAVLVKRYLVYFLRKRGKV